MENHLLEEEIKKYNRDSTSFIFNETDLFKEEEKFKTSSPELQNLLSSLAESNINTIIFLNQSSSFLKKQVTCPDFRWIMVKKENISEKVKNGILYLSNNDYNLITGWTNLNFLTDDETWKKIKQAESEKNRKNEILSFFREINTEIEVNGICRGDLEGFYVVNLPVDCGCEVVPNSSAFLYLNHIKYCCSEFQEIVKFKNDIISAIPKVKEQLNNFKQGSIKKVEDEMKKKAVSKEEGEKLLPNWKNKLTLLRSMKELEENRDFFLKKICDFSGATNKEEQERVYEETQAQTEELEKEQAENRNKEQQEQENLNNGRQKDKKTNSDNQPTNNKPSPDKGPKTSNNPLPSPSEIQNNYNSDKDKSIIDNNPTLTNPEQKDQANELLKIVISAELLIKKKQFNLEILTKLLAEKKNNTSLYQLLNKEGRIDEVISQLESIQKPQKVDNNPNKDNLTSTLLPIGVIFAFLLVVSSALWIAKKRKSLKKAKKS